MKAFKAAVIILALAAVLGVFREARAYGVLSFANQAEVASHKVTLRDLVASAKGLDAAFDKRLAGVKVAEAPKVGRSAKVEGARVRDLLALAKPPRDVSVLIPSQVEIRRASQRVTTSQINQIFHQALQNRSVSDNSPWTAEVDSKEEPRQPKDDQRTDKRRGDRHVLRPG